MAENWGLLNNMASGIKEAMTLYQTTQANKRQEKMMGLLQGVETNPETGEFQYTPEKQAEIELKRKKEALDLQKAEQGLGLEKAKTGIDAAKIGMKFDETGGLIKDEANPVFRKTQEDAQVDRDYKKALIQSLSARTQNKTKGGRPLTAGSAENLGASKSALSALDDIESLANSNEEMFGKGVGLIGNIGIKTGIGETATKAASIEADLMSKAQTIGRFLEGGKLAEGDIARYAKMLPQRGDKPEIVTNKIATLRRMVQQKYDNDRSGYGAAGYDVEAFEELPISEGLIKGVGKKKERENSKAGASQEPDVASYAKSHNISYEDALRIKMQRTSKQAGK
jgi:hypothetical protein